MHGKKEFGKLASDFRDCREVLIALGDENRLHLLYQMMIAENPIGIRVGEITKRTNLSRTAVSHHLKLLKDAGVVKVRREGTRNYYYLDPDMKSFKALISVLDCTAFLERPNEVARETGTVDICTNTHHRGSVEHTVHTRLAVVAHDEAAEL